MSKKLVEEMKKLNKIKLSEELDNAVKDLFTFRTQASTGQLSDVYQIRKTRRKIALIRTLLKEVKI